MRETFDHRLHAYRSDLADIRLEGRVEAARFAEAKTFTVTAPVVDLKSAPDRQAGTDTQLLMGERIGVFERAAGWCWVQAERDGYVGYIEEDACRAGGFEPTHRVVVPRTFCYPDADLRFPPTAALSAGSHIAVADEAETRGTRYFRLADGESVIARHCLPLGETAGSDYVAVAATFMETPYLWGGRSGFGIDCSGLVQLALQLAGHEAPRDTDMQAAGLGTAFDPRETGGPARGDLVFWKGHVGIMEDAATLLHASGHTMTVTREPLDAAIARIAQTYGPPTRYRRIAGATTPSQ